MIILAQELVKPSQQFFKFVQAFVLDDTATEQENEVKKDYWTKMKTELEVSGYPLSLIGRTIHDSIEEELWKKKFKDLGIPREEFKWHSGYFYRWCKTEGISQIYGKLNENIPLGDSSINTDNAKEKVIQLLEKTKELSNELIKKFKDTPQILQTFTQEQFNDFYSQWETILKIDEDAIDEKTKIPDNTVHMLLQCLAVESSLTHGAEIFMRTRIKMMEDVKKFLTPKQATKFQRGEIKDQPPILNPKNRELAIFLRYYGQQCSKCNSFCMKEIIEGMKTKVKCITCNNIEDPTTIAKCRYCQIPLYKENLQHIVKTGKCENCNEETTLPEELVLYANQ